MDVRPGAPLQRHRRPHPARRRDRARRAHHHEALQRAAARPARHRGAGDGLRRSRALRQRPRPPRTRADPLRGAGRQTVSDAMPCNPLITDPFVFPAPPANRAGLPRIAYRIGRYGDFVEAMIRRIDAAPELAAWTHRNADDPGIALIEGAAIIGDILTFYQEHYANEAFLRTAAWRESIAELVRLTGYRLAPGIGGHATFAFEVRGKIPVTIPA